MNVVQSAHSSPAAVMSIICQFKQFPCSRVAAVRTPLLKAANALRSLARCSRGQRGQTEQLSTLNILIFPNKLCKKCPSREFGGNLGR